MIKQFIIFIVFGIIITIKRTNCDSFVNFVLNFFNTQIKVKGIKNLKDFNNKRIVIMANHLNGFDYAPIFYTLSHYTKNKKKIYTVAKHNIFGDPTDKNIVSNSFALIKDQMFSLLNVIPYERNNKKSGEIVKKIMLNKIDEGDTILLFPEGKPTRTGIPTEFKPGSFRLCAENDIEILPITLEFDKKIGVDTTDPVRLEKWFNLTTTIYIHKPIFDKDWEILKNKVFDKIRTPLLNNNTNNNTNKT
jgi:1-acyl-sn-glycerol-3-phosphate acyltransferase